MIDHLSKYWKSYPILLTLSHEFKCAALNCKFKAHHYLDTKGKALTRNLIKHVKACWGNKAWHAANKCS